MSFHAFAALCALVLVAAQDLELPVQTCKHDADDYSSCLRLAMQEAWPNFIQGIPQLEIPVLDPYFTEHEHAVYEANDINADITMTNTNSYGLAKARYLAVRPTYGDNYYKLEVDMEVPKMLLEGNFKAVGSMGAFKIAGDGFFNISMEDIKATWFLEGPVVNDRWTIERFNLNPEIGKMKIWFSDFFNGNEGLNHAALMFVNEYWPSLYRTMLPFLTENWNERVVELSNRVLSKISFSKTFP